MKGRIELSQEAVAKYLQQPLLAPKKFEVSILSVIIGWKIQSRRKEDHLLLGRTRVTWLGRDV